LTKLDEDDTEPEK